MNNNQDKNTKLFIVYALTAVSFLVLMAFVPPLSDHSREWKRYQKKFLSMMEKKAKSDEEREEIKNTPLEIKQIILKEFNKVDRCTTCHLGVNNPDLKNATQPFRAHPNSDQHPFEQFGCTICHAGQGRATTVKAAHGRVPFWESPLIPTGYLQSSCGKCHLSQDIPGAPDLSEGRKIYRNSGCAECHKIGNEGGNMGPDLTKEGRFGHRDPEWLYKHFKDPQAVIPDSEMPNYDFTDEEAKALTMYMLSLTDEKIGGYYYSKKLIPDITTGKNLFMEKGCIGCHALQGEGGSVGPDLANVKTRRSADWIYSHLKKPSESIPGTVMPNFGFSNEEAKAITLFLLSLSEKDVVGFIRPGRD